MSLIVEDGTGLPDANSFASLAEADAQHADWETAEWFAKSDYQKTAGLLEGFIYLVGTYSWVGYVQFEDQGAPWPRLEAYDHEGRIIPPGTVPLGVKQAQIYLAAQGLSGALQPATTATSGALKRKKVGPLELEYFEGTSATAATGRSFPAVSGMLRGLTRGGPGGISGSVVRWS